MTGSGAHVGWEQGRRLAPLLRAWPSAAGPSSCSPVWPTPTRSRVRPVLSGAPQGGGPKERSVREEGGLVRLWGPGSGGMLYGGGRGRRHGRDGAGTAENRPPELLTLTCGLTSRLSDADARPGWAHSHPRHPLPLAPSSPSPGPGRPLLCLLSLSGCRSVLLLSLGFLVYKVLCAKRLARCLEQSKRSVPATNSVRSFLH